jgi:hypothetical protein
MYKASSIHPSCLYQMIKSRERRVEARVPPRQITVPSMCRRIEDAVHAKSKHTPNQSPQTSK